MRYIAIVVWCWWSGQGLGSDYLGCYLNAGNSGVNNASNHLLRKNNSRNTCKDLCKSENTRYAGTKNKVYCLCGNNLVGTTKTSDDFCNKYCPNVNDEHCGGVHHIQVYDLWPCRNGAWCNGSKCQDLNGTDYRCQCPDGWTGKHCDKTTTESPSTTTTTTPIPKTTTTIQNVNISSTIVGNGTEPTTSVYPTSVTAFYDKDWFIVTISVVAVVLLLNCVCLTVWCIYKRNTNDHEMEPENIENKSGVHVISGNQYCFEMETLQEYGEKGTRCSLNEETDMYALIDDTDMSIYENLDLANHCEQSERLFSGIYSNVK